ncbi:hypothetical protein P22_2542 [Propionispora sp. 2/2-37]|uniref:hypothetical protein n=1 Tax=Propionispora sp. 2/2-37 TaxID=1677858 RepID=UPI0006BB766F|nr:hypothetical protein [Propionispora sp. 2/2-37]CUH96452.1 hypothetical protein P22_2542 [Propionispora sp. 2/2-37]
MEFKTWSRKSIAAFVIGTFMLAGAAASPLLVQAAEAAKDRPVRQQQKMDPDQVAQHIADKFNISKDTVLKYQQAGYDTRDIVTAAFFGQLSGKPFEEVIKLKTNSNTWKDVQQTLGITTEQIKTAHINMFAGQINAKTGLDTATATTLLNQGYHPRDIAVAAQLAKNTGKNIQDVLDLKKINNTWKDVADSLGVSQDTLKQDMQEIRGLFPHHRGPGANPEHEGK